MGLIFVIVIVLTPFALLALLIYKVRKRRKREAIEGKRVNPSPFSEPFSLRTHWLTCLLLLLLATIYYIEMRFALPTEGNHRALSPLSLLAVGGLSRNAFLAAGTLRIFTAPFLHASVIHLLANGVALFYAGRILEKPLGRRWFLAVYFISAVCGSLMSLAMNAHVVSVGASGAIMGLFAAILAMSFHADYRDKKPLLQATSLRIIIPSMIPQTTNHGALVDYAAHFGGLLGGGLCVSLMLLSWPAESKPNLRWLAGIIATGGILASIVGFLLITLSYPSYVVFNECLLTQSQQAGITVQQYVKSSNYQSTLDQCIHSHSTRP